MVFEPAAEAEEVLSPELVLVATPEVAQRARERLPEWPGIVLPATTPPWVPYPRIAIEELLPDRRRRRKRGPLLLAACLLAAVAAAGYLAETRWLGGHDDPAPRVAAPPVTPRASRTQIPSVPKPQAHPKRSTSVPKSVPKPQTQRKRLPSVPAPKAHVTQKTLPKPAAVRPVTVTHSPAVPTKPTPKTHATTHARAAVKPKPTIAPPSSAPAFIPSRTWAWVPSAGASAYDVSFFLNGKVVLHVRPTAARLVLPGRFRYRAGHYRWTVRPLGATAIANPIVDGDFVLTTAAAAAANHS